MTKAQQNGGGAAARKAGGIHKPAAATACFLQADLAECPLCVEPLDDTDRDFWPCPCGYQVCLFCYQRLQSEYNNTCPGCRQQYSDDLEGVRQHIARKQKQQQAEAVAARHAPPAHHHQQQHQGGRAGKAVAGAAEQRAHHDLHPRAPDTPSSSNGLPLTANWVAAAGAEQQQHHHHHHHQQQQQHEVPPPAARDDSAWPTLGAAQQQQHAAAGHERRRSSSSSLTTTSLQQQHHHHHHQQHAAQANGRQSVRSSFESIASTHTSTLHASEHQQQQQRQQDRASAAAPAHQSDLSRSGSGYTPVEVTTVVGGKRCSVCVPVSGQDPQVEPLPEAASLLGMLQQAVSSSKLTSTEAAVQLVQCLRKLDVDSNGRQAGHSFLQQVLASSRNGGLLPAAGRAPPGFAQHLRSGGGAHQQQQQSQQGETPQSSMHSVDSSSSLFSAGSSLSQSVWTDSGLPGVDLGVSRLSGGLGNGNGLPASRLQQHWGGGGNGSSGGGGSGPSAALAGPPPGFAASAAGTAALAGSRLYNPLAAAAAANGNGSLGLPPGFGVGPAGAAAVQPGAYRPFA